MPLQGAIPMWYEVMTNFEGVDMASLLVGAIAGYQSLYYIIFLFSGSPISPRYPRKRQKILSSASRPTVAYINNTRIGFCYLGSISV